MRVDRIAAPDRWAWLMAAIAVAGFVVLLWLGRGLTFFWDEWAFIEGRSLGEPSSWFLPHNEHWTTLPFLVYRVLVETVGLRSYLPYLAVVTALHLAVVAAVFRLVRDSTRSGPVALAAGLIVLLFGSGFENLFWGFQLTFVGSTALSLWAMVALRGEPWPSGRRIAVAVGLLVAAVASAGVSIVFITAIAAELVLDARRRSLVVWLAIPAAVAVGWYLAVGRFSNDPSRLIGPESILELPRSIVLGFGTAAGAITGTGPQIGLAVGIAILGAALARSRRLGSLPPTFLGPMVGIVALYELIGLTRGEDAALNPRFTYETGILLLVGLAALAGPIRLPERRDVRLAVVATSGVALAVSLAFNVRLLFAGRDLFLVRADLTRALITAALDPDRPPEIDPERSLVLVPSPASLGRIVDLYGSPLTDQLSPDAVRPISAELLAEARTWLIEGPPPQIRGGPRRGAVVRS